MNKIRYWSVAFGIMVCLVGTLSRAQTTQPTQEKPANIITRSVDVKNTDPRQLSYTLAQIAKLSGVLITVDDRNKLLLLTGEPERISDIESLVHRLDTASVPEKDLEITVYLLTAGETAGPSQEIPPQLDPVLKQLRTTFTYKSYQLLDTIFMRNRIGAEGRTNGYLPLGEPEKKPGAIVCGLIAPLGPVMTKWT